MSIADWFKNRVVVSLASSFDDAESGTMHVDMAYDEAVKKQPGALNTFCGPEAQSGSCLLFYAEIKTIETEGKPPSVELPPVAEDRAPSTEEKMDGEKVDDAGTNDTMPDADADAVALGLGGTGEKEARKLSAQPKAAVPIEYKTIKSLKIIEKSSLDKLVSTGQGSSVLANMKDGVIYFVRKVDGPIEIKTATTFGTTEQRNSNPDIIRDLSMAMYLEWGFLYGPTDTSLVEMKKLLKCSDQLSG